MKIDISFLTGFFRIGNDLLARAALQGVEQALIATAIEYGTAAMVCISTRARVSTNLRLPDRAKCDVIVQR